ncbi:hypothetical protein CCP2SC5_440034 [Azospirillaceae bacterium]
MKNRKLFKNFLILIVGVSGLSIGGFLVTHLFDFGSPIQYVVTTDNSIRPATENEFGIRHEEALFVAKYRRPITSSATPFDRQTKTIIRNALLSDYENNKTDLNHWAQFESDRERFIAFLMLRVNGSLPVYNVHTLFENASDYMISREGRCHDQAIRLLMILDIFSIKGRGINWHTPAIEGHEFVDAYDPQENKSYFLDSTNNLMAKIDAPNKDVGFLDVLAAYHPSERKRLIASRIKQFPIKYESMIGVVERDFRGWEEDNFVRVRDSTITGLAYEFPMMIEKWKTGQWPLSYSLCQKVDIKNNQGMLAFEPHNCLTVDSLLR